MSRRIPKVISIDAFNTLFVPKKPVLSLYAEVGLKYGLDVTEEQLSDRFPKVFKEMKTQYPNYGKAQNLNYEDWWSQLIQKLYSPTKVDNNFIIDLMKVFSSDLGYSGYEDVSTFLEKYSKRPDILFVASSNGDPRVIKVLESLNLLHHFKKVYLSYDIEVSKPSQEFFNYIIDDLLTNSIQLEGISKKDLLGNSWHIGDEIGNDLNGPVESGWKGILVDRKNEYQSILSKITDFDESDLAKIKLNTDFTNTTLNTNSVNEVETPLKLDERRSIVQNFNQIASIIGL